MTNKMKTDLKEIERNLQELNPAKLPDDLDAKIEKIFKNSLHLSNEDTTHGKIIWLPKMQKLSAAAALLIASIGVFFATLNDQNSSNEATTSKNSVEEPVKGNQFIPINAKKVFEGVKDDGFFLSKDKTPYHGLRYQFSDSFLWENEEDGSSIEMEVPSQRLFFVPIKTD